MYAFFALVATVLTSLLPILNKRILRDARPSVVAWAINAASLPVLVVGTILFTQCRLAAPHALTCAAVLPRGALVFVLAILGSAALNWAATLLSTRALAAADASLVGPLLTFNPAFTLLVAWLTLGETPGLRETLGVGVILLGAYLLEVKEARSDLLAPIRVLLRRPGTALAVLASALWGITTVLEKLAIEHTSPPSGPLVALAGTLLTVALLTPGAIWPGRSEPLTGRGLRAHPRALLLAALIAGVAPLFGFTAIAVGEVGYVTALFKLSAVLTVLWARVLLGEGELRQRLLGALVMVAGGVLVVV